MNAPSDKRERLSTVLSVIRTGDLAQARDLLRALIKEYPNDAEVWFTAALAAENRTQQIRILERSVSLDPGFNPAVKLLDDLESQQLLDSIQMEGDTQPESASIPHTGPTVSRSSIPAAQVVQTTPQSRRSPVLIIVGGIGFAVLLVALILKQIIAPGTSTTDNLSVINSPVGKASATSTTNNLSVIDSPIGKASATSTTDSLSAINSPVDPLPYRFVAAAYSNALDRVIIVSDGPVPVLHIYDPEKKTDQTVALPKAPTCLGLSADGKFAAVGHDGLVSYVDLQGAKLVKTLDLTTVAYSLVVANNGWIYVMPQRDQWVNFHMLQISTNTESTSQTPGRNTLVYAGGKLVLTADGMSFYQIDRNLTPTTIYRHTLASDGSISDVTAWPYHGAYNHCGDAWPSADSRRLITACGVVFRQSPDPKQDMTYNGSLPNIGAVYSAAQSVATNTIIAVATPSLTPTGSQRLSQTSPFLYFFDYASLSQSAKLQLPNFSNGEQANGQFVFTNSAGTRFYVLVTSVNAKGAPNATQPTGDNVSGVVVADVPGATASANGGATSGVPTTPSMPPPTTAPAGSLTMLTYGISAADYSKSLDRLILLSSDVPPTLHIYDPKTQADTAVRLLKQPTALSVSPDGKFAVVGHDALVSYIDLTTHAVVKTYDVTFPVTNVMASGNGWIYASGQDQSYNSGNGSVAIELSNGQEQSGFSGAGRVTPDGQAAYVGGTNSDSFYRVDISQGSPKQPQQNFRDYNSNPVCGPIWLSEDGKRIFTGCSTVLRASGDPKQDMSYNGKLDRLTRVSAVAQSGASGRVLAIGLSDDPKVLGDNKLIVYNYETLNTDKIVDLPMFAVGGTSVPGHGRYVFFNSDGLDYYVIMQADGKAGLLNDFGIASMKLDNITLAPNTAVTAIPIPTNASEPSTSVSSPIHMLDFSVAAAEYSQALDRIIISSAAPNGLIIYDPAANQKVTVALSRPPLSFALSADGLYAAVGHDASISIVDLKAAKVLNTYDIPVTVTNLDYAPNGYVYVFPDGQWTSLYMLNVKTGAVTFHGEQFIWGNGSSTLYQDGTRIYYGQNGLSPSTLYRVDLGDDGTAGKAQKWPYWGEYGPCGHFWLAQDGKRLFTACGTVFKTSSDPKQDMAYNGTLTQALYSGPFGIKYSAITHALQARLIYALPNMDGVQNPGSSNQTTPVKQKLLIFDYDSLQYQTALDLPQFVTQNAASVDGQGYYMFVNSQGSQLYVIMEANKGSGLLNDFGIWTTKIDQAKAEQ